MKRKNLKNCPSFKSIINNDAIHNKPLASNCYNCVYFSTKNCHFEASDEIEPDLDFL